MAIPIRPKKSIVVESVDDEDEESYSSTPKRMKRSVKEEASSARKRHSLTIEKKLEIIKRHDEGEAQKTLAEIYRVGRTTVSDILKKRDKLISFLKESTNQHEDCVKRQRAIRRTAHKDLEDKLNDWYNEHREKGSYVSGPMLAQQAKELHSELGYSGSFNASNGWLDRFKCRYGIKLSGIQEVKHETDTSAVEPFKQTVQTLIRDKNLSAEQIYNSDEFDFFWKIMPNPDSEMDEVKSTVRVYRERITVLACTNATGNHKLPLVCIGRGKASRSFNAAELKNLPTLYYSQETAWMDAEIFKDWFFNRFVPAVREYLSCLQLPEVAVLFIDSSTAHPTETIQTEDGNFQVHFFPTKVKNRVQPMQQGIVENLKRHYRKDLLVQALSSGLTLNEFHGQLTLNLAVKNIANMWQHNITSDLIALSFTNLLSQHEETSNLPHDESISIAFFERLIRQFPECATYPTERITQWLNCDEVDQQPALKYDESSTSMVIDYVDDDYTEQHIEEESIVEVYIDYPPTEASNAQKDLSSGEIKAEDDFIDEQVLMHEDDVVQTTEMQAIVEDHRCVEEPIDGPITLGRAIDSINTLLEFMENDDESLYQDVKALQKIKLRLEKRRNV